MGHLRHHGPTAGAARQRTRTDSDLVLKSRRIVPGRLLQSGFRFDFADWNEAARDLVARWREGRQGKG